MKLLFTALLTYALVFSLQAQNLQFERVLTGIAYCDIAPLKGVFKRDAGDRQEFECKRIIYGFETVTTLMNGQLMIMSLGSPSAIISIKDFTYMMKKGIAGFDRIDDITMKANDPASTIESAGFLSADKLRTVSLFISSDSVMRIILADKPGSAMPELFYMIDRKTKKVGYKDVAKPLYWRIAPKYSVASLFSERLAAVNIGGKEEKYGFSGGKWGFVDMDGNEVIPIIYESVTDFSEGLSSVNVGGKYGFINKKGEVVIPIQYTYAMGFEGGMARVGLGTESFYIDRNGVRIGYN